MSTKSSIAYVPDKFHLYTELWERDGSLHLHLEGVEFEATPAGVTVTIPATWWDVLRRYGIMPNFPPASDADIAREAERLVDERAALPMPAMRSLRYREICGDMSLTRDEQIAHAVNYLAQARRSTLVRRAERDAILRKAGGLHEDL